MSAELLVEQPGLSEEQKDSLVFASGETHPDLARRIAGEMGVEMADVIFKRHRNTESYLRYEDSVRGKLLIAFQPHVAAKGRSVDEALNQHLDMIDAGRLASAEKIVALSTVLANARQDQRYEDKREPISAARVLRTIKMVGADHVVTLDPHSPKSLSAFNGPVDPLSAQHLLRGALRGQMEGDKDRYLVLSPDVGHAKMSLDHAEELGIDVVYMPKTKDPEDNTRIIRSITKIPEADGRVCFILDDMIDTAGTMISAAEVAKDSGAEKIYIAATHGFFSGPAYERLRDRDSPVDHILVTDSLPVEVAEQELGERLQVVRVAKMIADSLVGIATGGSVRGRTDIDTR